MAKSKQKWRIGDVFTIATTDRRFAIGQIIGQEPDLMRSVTVALFDERYGTLREAGEKAKCDPANLFAILFVTVNHLESGDWHIVGHRSATVDSRFSPHEQTRIAGFVGAKVVGSGIVNDFVEAFYGLAPWDDWKDPHYLDSLLISTGVKPVDRLVYKN
jgi:Immunity protein 26